MSFDFKRTIELLISDPEGSQLTFPHEREIRLYQFHTWIYRPESSIVELAGAFCGSQYLGELERKLTPLLLRNEEQDSTELKRFLKDKNYSKLYDATVGQYGGWLKFVRGLQRIDLRHEVLRSRDVAETVCNMIGYRFRYLDHGGTDRQHGLHPVPKTPS